MDVWDIRGIDLGLERVTIQEAARKLGVSEGAVRKRVTRKTLSHDKDPDGRVYVYLDERTIRGRGVDDGTRGRGVDDGQDAGVDPHNNALISRLISRLEGEVEFLRDQVKRQQEILAQQAVTMRQLSAPPEEAPGDDETVGEAPGDDETVEEAPEPRPATPPSSQTAPQPPQTAPQPPQGGTLRGLRRRVLGW
jgi:hypothetical protein